MNDLRGMTLRVAKRLKGKRLAAFLARMTPADLLRWDADFES